MSAYRELKNDLRGILSGKLSTPTMEVNNRWGLQWDNELAIQVAYQMRNLIGREPDLIIQDPGGMTFWEDVDGLYGGGYYPYIEIRDVFRLHSFPEDHLDFLCMSYKRKLKCKTPRLIPSISESITYNGVSEMINAGCHFPGASIASFAVVRMLDDGEICKNKAALEYASLIEKVAKEWSAQRSSSEDPRRSSPITTALEKYIFSD